MSVIFEARGGVAFVRLNRPDKLNALSREMMLELGRLFELIQHDSQVRAVILTGEGLRAFCAGTDIGELASLDVAGALEASQRGQEVCDIIERCRVPVIAAVRGIAAGGGCELALACHLRVAAEDAVFSLPGKNVNAAEALRLGLVNRVAESARLLDEAESLALEIASLAPLAIRACLEAVTRGLALPLAEGLALEAELFSQLFATADVREGTRAFLEKRAPVFQGR